MTQQTKTPPAATGGVRKCHRRAASDGSEHNPTHDAAQQLRAAFLSRRHRLDASMAALIAEIAYQVTEVR